MERTTATRPVVLMPHEIGANVFIAEIAAGYRDAGFDVVFGPENLAHGMCHPALVHLHWPEEHAFWGQQSSTVEERARRFIERVTALKKQGATIVWEVHNLKPHESQSHELEHGVYQALIDRCDVIVHHCDASIGLLAECYSVPASARAVVTPIGNYTVYPNTATRASARERLKLPADRFVFLHFGAIRAYKGLDLLLEAFSAAKVPRKMLLVAGRYVATKVEENRRERLRLAVRRRLSPNLRFDLGMITDDEVQYYMNAADVVVLSHRWGLNSAVAVLGMTFGRPVVGPDCGCIGHVLRAGGNIVYETGSSDGLTRALEQSAGVDLAEVGARNRAIVAGWRWQDIAGAVLRGLEYRTGDGAAALGDDHRAAPALADTAHGRDG